MGSGVHQLQKLSIVVQGDFKTEIVVIFAEPDYKDIEFLLKEKASVLDAIKNLLESKDFTKTEAIESGNPNDSAENNEVSSPADKSDKKDVKNEQLDCKALLDIEIKDEETVDDGDNLDILDNIDDLETWHPSPPNKVAVKRKPRTNTTAAGRGIKRKKVAKNKQLKDSSDFDADLNSDMKVQKLDPDTKNNYIDGVDTFENDYNDDLDNKENDMDEDYEEMEDDEEGIQRKQMPPSKRIANYPCDSCDKVFYKPCRLQRHLRNFHMKQTCEHCGVNVLNKKALRKHMRMLHSSEVEGNFPCPQCDKKLYSEKYLAIHIEKVHDTEKPTQFMCQECGKTFEQRSSLKSHIEIQHEKLEKFSCNECNEKFLTYYRLTCHMEKVHTDKAEVFMCTKCGKQIVGKKRFQSHVNNHPTNFKMVTCEVCEQVFPETQIKSHMKEFHSNKKMRYQCPFCPKKMEKRAFIRCHVRTHTGAKPYSCEKCEKHYISSASVRRHVRVYHRGDHSLMKYDREIDRDNPFAKLKSKL